MTRVFNQRWAAGILAVLACSSMPASANYGRPASAPFDSAPVRSSVTRSHWIAGSSSGAMRVGLTLVDGPPPAALPDPASLDFPATARAIRCESQGQHYRECQTPFRGPVALAREVSGTRCVEDQNWGWREGRVWVDRGCAAVFVTTGES